MSGDPEPGTFVFGERQGVALARNIGTLCVEPDQLVPLIERGEMIVPTASSTRVGSYAYARPSDGVIVADADGGKNKLIGWWVTASDANGLAQLHVDLRLDGLSRP